MDVFVDPLVYFFLCFSNIFSCLKNRLPERLLLASGRFCQIFKAFCKDMKPTVIDINLVLSFFIFMFEGRGGVL